MVTLTIRPIVYLTWDEIEAWLDGEHHAIDGLGEQLGERAERETRSPLEVLLRISVSKPEA